MGDKDWDVLPLYEPEGHRLFQDVDTGRGGYQTVSAPQETMDAGQAHQAAMEARKRAGMGGSDRSAPKRASQHQPKQMSQDDMLAWAQRELANTETQRAAHDEAGAMFVNGQFNDNINVGASSHRQEQGLAQDNGPGQVPEWLTRYMEDSR